MCIHHQEKPYKCCCCLPIIFGVIFICALEVLNLVEAINTLDIFNMVLSGLTVAMFIFTFVKHYSPKVRRHLFHTYVVNLILFLVYMIYWLVTQPLTPMVDRICNGVNKVFDWSNCATDVEDTIWVFVMIYTVILVLVRLMFIRILYHYWKEVADEHHGHDSQHQQQYQTLPDSNKNAAKNNNSVNDDHVQTNAMH